MDITLKLIPFAITLIIWLIIDCYYHPYRIGYEKIKQFIWKIIFAIGCVSKLWNRKKKYNVLYRTSRKDRRENERFIEQMVTQSFANHYRGNDHLSF